MRRTVCCTCAAMDSGHRSLMERPGSSVSPGLSPRTALPPTQERITPSRRTIIARSGRDRARASRISVSILADTVGLTSLAQYAQGVDGVVTALRRRVLDDDAVGNQGIDVCFHRGDDRLVHCVPEAGHGLGTE